MKHLLDWLKTLPTFWPECSGPSHQHLHSVEGQSILVKMSTRFSAHFLAGIGKPFTGEVHATALASHLLDC